MANLGQHIYISRYITYTIIIDYIRICAYVWGTLFLWFSAVINGFVPFKAGYLITGYLVVVGVESPQDFSG